MNQIRRILAANNIRTFSIISRATRLRKSTGTVGTIMAVKITGYLELIGIGLEHIWCRPLSFFLSLLRVQLGKVAATIYGTTCTTRRKRERERAANIVYAVCNDARRRLFQKSRGTSIKTLFLVDLIESVNPWRLIGTAQHLTRWSLIVVVGLIVERRVYGSVNNFNILLEFYFIPSRCLFHSSSHVRLEF